MVILEEKFDGGLKHALYSNFSKYTEAILELVDNSVSNRMDGMPLKVNILVNRSSITIMDSGGKGMDIKSLKEFLEWGKLKPREAQDIGAYSQGGKSAMGYLGSKMKLTTSPLGEKKQYTIEDDNLYDFKLKKYKVIETPVSFGDGRTQIDISNLQKNVKEDVMKSLLGDTYRPLIIDKKVVIKYNGDIVKPIPYPLDDFKKENFSFDGISGWVGRLTPRSGTKGGLRCYTKGRLICDREFFSRFDATYKATLNFLFGEVHLDKVPANTNKTDFNRDSKQWLEAENEIFTVLKPHINELLGRETKEPTGEEKDRVKKTQNIFAELMKRRKKDLAGSTLLNTDIGQKQPELRNKNKEIEVKEARSRGRKNKPQTPPPKNAIGKRRRLKEFMKWDIRAIDEAVRSVIEKNGKLLVINNQFSGYIASKGIDLYLLETAALQCALPEKDEKIPPQEYLREFDELYSYICENLDTVKEDIKKRKK